MDAENGYGHTPEEVAETVRRAVRSFGDGARSVPALAIFPLQSAASTPYVVSDHYHAGPAW